MDEKKIRAKRSTQVDDDSVMQGRLVIAALTKHLKSLPVSQEHTIPLVSTQKGEGKVPLNVAIKVLTVFEINDVKQTINTGLYISFQWNDKALAWDMSQYGEQAEIQISRDSIWTPYVNVPNSRDIADVLQNTKYIGVEYDGNVTAHTAILLETSCSMDLTWYPYDEQTCTIKFLSKSAPIEWIVEKDASDKDLAKSLALNSEWELTNVSTRLYLESGENPNPEVVVRLRRKTRFYSVCLILPMVVTSYMNTLVFVVPLQAGEKVSFLVSLYVSTSVFTSFFSTTMPRGLDSTPLSVKLLIEVIVESVLVMLATLLVLKIFHDEQETSAVSGSNPEQDSRDDDQDPIKQLELNNAGAPPHTTELHPQPLQDPPKPRGAWLSSRSQSVTPLDRAGRASRAARCFAMRGLTSHQLDIILFVIFFAGNSIFLVALLYPFL
ncbi:hypothetical protein ACOMHN_064849 [Nucella lapillus]